MRRDEERYKTNWLEYIADGQLGGLVEALGYDPRGCEHCRYGVVSRPAGTEKLGIPLYILDAMLLKMGELLLCDCRAGQGRRRYTERQLTGVRDAGVVVTKEGLAWSNGCPDDYIPGKWWQLVRDAIETVPTIHGRQP
jgi:hypothetical protein